MQLEVNAVGRVIRELDRREGTQGQDVNLTIDLDLQKSVLERLGDESASAVVMDARNGEGVCAPAPIATDLRTLPLFTTAPTPGDPVSLTPPAGAAASDGEAPSAATEIEGRGRTGEASLPAAALSGDGTPIFGGPVSSDNAFLTLVVERKFHTCASGVRE